MEALLTNIPLFSTDSLHTETETRQLTPHYLTINQFIGMFFSAHFQGSESQVSLSDMTCSESASSFQSVSQSSTPEILVGLVYNATTGRLSVEIIKGIHFKNLAANKPPSKYSL